MRFDLTDLRLFLYTAEAGSITAGAARAHLTLASASARIRGMEDALGVPLLQRSTRAVHVTDVGSAFYQHCEAMTQAARAAFEVAEHAGEKPSGRLRVSCPVGVAHVFIAPVLSKFLRAQPDVRLELDVTNRRVDVIGEGYDVALRVRSTLEDSNLVVRSFGVSDQVLVASPAFVAEHGPFDTPESMRGAAGVGFGRPGERARWRLTTPEGGSVDIEFTPALVTDDLYLMGQTALEGVGIAQLPFNLCADAIRDGRLVVLLPNYRLPAHQFHAVFPSRRGLVPAVRAFIEFLAEELPDVTARVSRCYEDIARQPNR